MIVDNVPICGDGIIIECENVTILNSTFKNIKSEYMEMDTDPLLRQLIIKSQANYGMGVEIYATNVKIMGTTFENFTLGGNDVYGFVLTVDARNNTLIENCTFKDITGESLNRTEYDSSSRKYISELVRTMVVQSTLKVKVQVTLLTHHSSTVNQITVEQSMQSIH